MTLWDEVQRVIKAFDPNQLRDRQGRWAKSPHDGKVRVYHGTADTLWEMIQREGIRPAAETNVSTWDLEGERRKHVYVTSSENNALEWGEYALHRHRGSGVMILTVDVPVDQLTHDEGVLYGGDVWKLAGSIPPEWIKAHQYVPTDELP